MVDEARNQRARWTHLSWREVREAAADRTVVIVPIGCVETQGPFTPVGMEHLMADRLARDVAARTGSLALPGLPFGNSDNFRFIPGTIYIRLEVLIELYKDVLLSIVRSGFDRILCIAYHIPNQPALERAAQFVRDQTGVLVTWINPGALAATYLSDLFDDPATVRGHGAEPGLSLCRYIAGTAAAPADHSSESSRSTYAGFDVVGGALRFRGYPVELPVNWEELYPTTGGYGDPTKADPEIGRQMYERLVDHLCGIVEVMQSTEQEQVASPASHAGRPVANPGQATP